MPILRSLGVPSPWWRPASPVVVVGAPSPRAPAGSLWAVGRAWSPGTAVLGEMVAGVLVEGAGGLDVGRVRLGRLGWRVQRAAGQAAQARDDAAAGQRHELDVARHSRLEAHRRPGRHGEPVTP